MNKAKKILVKIEIWGPGCVWEITGMPDDWKYEIVNHIGDHPKKLQAASSKLDSESRIL